MLDWFRALLVVSPIFACGAGFFLSLSFFRMFSWLDFDYAPHKHHVHSAQHLAHRSDYAFRNPSSYGVQAGRIGAGSSTLQKVRLVDTSKAHESARRQEATLQTLAKKYGATTTNHEVFRATYFGHATVLGDNVMSKCRWLLFPTIQPNWLDEACLRYSTTPQATIQTSGAHMLYSDMKCIMRNMANTKCEIDVWLCYPRHDMPTGKWAMTDFFTNDPTGSARGNAADAWSDPAYIKDQYAAAAGTPDPYITPPGAPATSATPFTVQALLYDDWSATPYESAPFCSDFHVVHRHHTLLCPGDEIEFDWGLKNGQDILPSVQLKDSIDDVKTQTYGFTTNYAMMKRCGPMVMMRVRGRLAHAEAESKGVDIGRFGHFGLFNVEFAIIRKWAQYKVPNSSWVSYHGATPSWQAVAGTLATIGTGGPQTVQQTSATNSNQWFEVAPSEPANANP